MKLHSFETLSMKAAKGGKIKSNTLKNFWYKKILKFLHLICLIKSKSWKHYKIENEKRNKITIRDSIQKICVSFGTIKYNNRKKSFSLFKNNVYNQSTLSKKKVLFSNLRWLKVYFRNKLHNHTNCLFEFLEYRQVTSGLLVYSETNSINV